MAGTGGLYARGFLASGDTTGLFARGFTASGAAGQEGAIDASKRQSRMFVPFTRRAAFVIAFLLLGAL